MSEDASERRPPLAVLVGPTAVGKSALAVEVALLMDGEIVTADSMQVYRGLDVGTAKPTAEERRGVPHHLIDVVPPGHPFNVYEYQRLATAAIAAIHGRGKLPILAGGTGLYVRAVVDDRLFPDGGRDPELRAHYERMAAEFGNAAVHRELSALDPESARRLHPNDRRRVIRALEVVRTTGKPLGEHWRNQPARSPYRAAWVGLTRPRPELYERIDRRTIEQVEGGLLAEARRLMALSGPDRGVALQALGYKEMFPYLRGECSLAEATRRLQSANRQYAKRQFTWFSHEPRLVWFDLSRYSDLSEAAAAVARHFAAQLDWPLP